MKRVNPLLPNFHHAKNQVNIILHQKPGLFIALVLLITMSGCRNFYMVKTGRVGAYTAGTIDSLQSKGRLFFLRTGTQAFFMQNLSFSKDRKTISFVPDTVLPDHKFYLLKGNKGSRQYKIGKPEEANILNEVHIYTAAESIPALGESYTLPLNQVQKIDVIEKDRKKTGRSHLLGTVVIGIPLSLIVLAIAWGDGFETR